MRRRAAGRGQRILGGQTDVAADQQEPHNTAAAPTRANLQLIGLDRVIRRPQKCMKVASTWAANAVSAMEDKKPAPAVAPAVAEEPSGLNVRLLDDGKDEAAARVAARSLAQNVREESSDFSRVRQVILLRASKRWTPGLVNFVPAVAYHFCLDFA